tara:strand:- start:4633 stop:4770 length:138 start_codon:yes stop_codon:yes gene_type:complete
MLAKEYTKDMKAPRSLNNYTPPIDNTVADIGAIVLKLILIIVINI